MSQTGENDSREVRFTAGPLGVTSDPGCGYFEGHEHDVQIGDRGLLMEPIEKGEAGWWLIAVGDYFCPAHESHFEVLDLDKSNSPEGD